MTAAAAAIRIDGSLLEGGGQILRMSVGLAALTDTPVRIFNIRGRRSKPGLKSQHLTGINLVNDLTNGAISGGSLNSQQIDFAPQTKPKGGEFSADVKTAGATTLLAQVSLPCLFFASGPVALDLKGGTDADMAPLVGYYERVFKPNLARFGADFNLEVLRKGYFPKGGGRVKISVDNPVRSLCPVVLTDQGRVTKVRIVASVAGTLPVKLAEEMADAAKRVISRTLKGADVETEVYKEEKAVGNGSSILVVAETSTGCILGDSGVGSAKVKPYATGEGAAKNLLASIESGGCVDGWMQDQLIIYMALAKGHSSVRTGPLTLHTETAINIAETFTKAKFEVVREEGSRIIKCQGIGLEN